MTRWLDKLGGRKFVLSSLLITLSLVVILVAVEQVTAAELGVLFGFWAAVAGVHGATNVAAKRYRPDGDPDAP